LVVAQLPEEGVPALTSRIIYHKVKPRVASKASGFLFSPFQKPRPLTPAVFVFGQPEKKVRGFAPTGILE